MIGGDRQKNRLRYLYAVVPAPIQRAETPFWSGEPTSKLEAQMHFLHAANGSKGQAKRLTVRIYISICRIALKGETLPADKILPSANVL